MRTNVFLPILLHVFCNKMLNFQTLRILLLSNSTQEFLLSLYLFPKSLYTQKKPQPKNSKNTTKNPKTNQNKTQKIPKQTTKQKIRALNLLLFVTPSTSEQPE